MHHTVVSVSAGVITIASPDLQVQEFSARKIHDLDYQEISDRASGMMVERILTHELHRVIGYWSRALGAQQDNPYDPFWEYLARSVCRAGGPMLREALPSVYREAEFHGPAIQKPEVSTPSRKPSRWSRVLVADSEDQVTQEEADWMDYMDKPQKTKGEE